MEAFRLTRQTENTPFPVYTKDNRINGLKLVISGVGKVKSAMAVTWLYSNVADGVNESSCLNVGIAGHPEAELGECYRINKIIDADDDKVYFPPQVATAKVAGKAAKTVSKPDLNYDGKELLEMEASGFYVAASKFVSGERLGLLKIVSDNKKSPADSLHAALVEELIATNMQHIEESVRALSALEQVSQEAAFLQTSASQLHQHYAEKYRFTVTRSRQVGALLDDCFSRNVSADVLHALKPKTSEGLLRELKSLRDAAPVFGR